MLLILLAACQTENNTEQACFLAYLDEAAANTSTWYQCDEIAEDEEASSMCSSNLDEASSTSLASLDTCAGEGCVDDWIGCVTLSNDISCYDDLEQCGGWVNTGIVDDCNVDAAQCGQSEGCAGEFYDCMVYAAGG